MEAKIVVTDRNDSEKQAGASTATQPNAGILAENVENTTGWNLQDTACYERGYWHGGINE